MSHDPFLQFLMDSAPFLLDSAQKRQAPRLESFSDAGFWILILILL
jgi:hypothetical protein